MAEMKDLLLTPEEIRAIPFYKKTSDEALPYTVLKAQLAKVLKHKETACRYCDKEADGPMLVMGSSMAHSTCVIQKLNELLDPDFEGKGDPSKIVGFLKHPSKKDRPELREEIDKHALAGTHRAIPALEAKSGEVIDVYLTTASTNKILDQLLLLYPDEEEIIQKFVSSPEFEEAASEYCRERGWTEAK